MYILYATDYNSICNIEKYFAKHSLYSNNEMEEYRVKFHTTFKERTFFFNDRILLLKGDTSYEIPFLSIYGYDKSIFPTEEELSILSHIQIIELENNEYKEFENINKYDKQIPKIENVKINNSLGDYIPALSYGYYQLIYTYFNNEVSYSFIIEEIKSKGIESICQNLRMLDVDSKEFQIYKKNLISLSDKILSSNSYSNNKFLKLYKELRQKANEENIPIHFNINQLISKGIIAKDKKILNYKELYEITKGKYEEEKLTKERRKLIYKNEAGVNWNSYLTFYPKSIHERKQFVGWLYEYDENGIRYQKPIDVLHSTKDNLYSASLSEEYNNSMDNAYSWTTLPECIKKAKELNLDGIGLMLGYELSVIQIKNGFINNEYSLIAKKLINQTQSFTTRQKNGDIFIYGLYKTNPSNNFKNVKIKGVSLILGHYENEKYIAPCKLIIDDGEIVNDCPIVSLKMMKNNDNFIVDIVQEDVFSLWDSYKNESADISEKEIIEKLSKNYNLKKKQYNGVNKFDELYYNGDWLQFYEEDANIDVAIKDIIYMFMSLTKDEDKIISLYRKSAVFNNNWTSDKIINLIRNKK